MQNIDRYIEKSIKSFFFRGKAILVYGARQVGKTTLIHKILEDSKDDVLFLNGDEPDIRELFQNITSTKLRNLIGHKKIIFIDEAQRISQIGLSLKLIIDQIKEVQVIASGSSSFDLQNRTGESLTGRKYEWKLFPFSFYELSSSFSILEEKRLLENRLIYGSYPEIVTHPGEEKELLGLLTESYLYKDILMMDNIHKPVFIEKIVKALALQIGSEVSYNELAKTVSSDPATVEKYIHILEKAFVVFIVPAFSKNVRNEIKKGKKIYFYDNGVRNAVLRNYQPLELRTDKGALWENYLMSERRKLILNNKKDIQQYFWRTSAQQEIDVVEEENGKLCIYEYKWSPKTKNKFPKTFTENYCIEKSEIISTDNYEEYLLSL
ncbi:MAG: ATP-binding protein [Leptospiraceae bacterium]|nr:ATP-binding protein [Leptospiraceae bacterium]MCP5498860.1 ATP-binding protein [Leptospiraceae bacterium]